VTTAAITRFEPPAGRDQLIRVAVKDAIDMAGVITTAGCAAVLGRAVPATVDALCLAGSRAPGVFIAGKTTLTELCVGPVGDNPVFGTPVNPGSGRCRRAWTRSARWLGTSPAS
jgi:amidase